MIDELLDIQGPGASPQWRFECIRIHSDGYTMFSTIQGKNRMRRKDVCGARDKSTLEVEEDDIEKESRGARD